MNTFMTSGTSTLKDLKRRISRALERAGRPRDEIRIIGVSKKQSVKKMLDLGREGLLDFGENYVQEWKKKRREIRETAPSFGGKIHWHFTGHLQRNKVKEVLGEMEYIHTVDSLKLAEAISRQIQQKKQVQKVLLEINVGGEKSKYGWKPEGLFEDLPALASLPGISLEGLMTIPPPVSDPEKARPYFGRLKSLLDECNRSGDLKTPMKELSMGMSQDFEIAVEEGATMIRIGTALFGPRS